MHETASTLMRLALGTSRDRWLAEMRPNPRGELELLRAALGSRMGRPSLLGKTADGEYVTLSGEDRKVHTEIIGAPGQGKSRLVELLIRDGVRNGAFQTFLDPGDGGATAKSILAWCCKVGFEKVLWINPADFGAAVPSFNPIKYRAPTEVAVGNVLDAVSVLWQSDFSDRVGFRKFAEVLLNVLHRGGGTLADIELFLDPRRSRERNALLSRVPDDIWKAELTKANRNQASFEGLINRFLVFSDPRLRLLLGPKRGLSFRRLITEGWLVLVNLDPQSVWGTQQHQQRLLGTLVINELVYALHNLREFENFKRPCYLYIDEVGDYATPKISFILDKKRKANLSLTLAHQRFGQILDKNVLSAIRTSTSVKVMFHTPDRDDRLTMQKDMGYGGEISDRDLAYTLRGLKVRQAAVTIGKAAPVVVNIRDVPDAAVHPSTMRAYVRRLYAHPFYRSPKEINDELNARFHGADTPRKPGGPHAGRPEGLRPQVAGRPPAADGGADSSPRPGAEARRKYKTVFPEGG